MTFKNIFTAAAVAALISSTSSIATAQTQFSDVYSPQVPSKITFCGKTVDLDPVEMYERFDRELTSLTYTHGNTMLTIKRANRYFPVMATILKRNGVPLDVLYLACVESMLNPRAYSPAKAVGIWQFIASTAKQYGLEVNDEVDERYNLEKATAAACRYLKKAYEKYGDWPTVFASYNGGMTRISKELEAQGVENAFDLYLTDETTRYPHRIMAMKAIMENPSAYGFHLSDRQLYQPRRYREVTVDSAVADWPAWAKSQGINYQQLREENPWIRTKKLTNKDGKKYIVKIPLEESRSRRKSGIKTYNPNWTDIKE